MRSVHKTSTANAKNRNFAYPTSDSIGSNVQDSPQSSVGARRYFKVVIACETVTLFGRVEDSYAIRAINQLKEAGGIGCVAVAT